MTYWPSSYWHIAESDGTFSVTWSVGIWVDRSCAEFLVDIIKPLLVEMLNGGGTTKFRKLHRKDGRVETPDFLAHAPQILQSLKSELQDACLRAWLESASKNWV